MELSKNIGGFSYIYMYVCMYVCMYVHIYISIIIACYFYLNDGGLRCNLYQTVMENVKIWTFEKFIFLQLLVGNTAINYINFFFSFFISLCPLNGF